MWEAILTLAFFFVLVVLAYMTEKNFFLGKKGTEVATTDDCGIFFVFEIKILILKLYILMDKRLRFERIKTVYKSKS